MDSEDSIEHIVRCPKIQGLFPREFQIGGSGRVPVKSCFLFGLDGRFRILMSLFVYGIYTLHNEIRHSGETREMRHSLFRIISAVPLSKTVKQAWLDICNSYAHLDLG